MEADSPRELEARMLMDYGEDHQTGEMAVHSLWTHIRNGADLETALFRVHKKFSKGSKQANPSAPNQSPELQSS